MTPTDKSPHEKDTNNSENFTETARTDNKAPSKCICHPAFQNAYHRDCPIHAPDKIPRDFSRLDHVIDHFSWDYDEGDLMNCAREYRDAYLAVKQELDAAREQITFLTETDKQAEQVLLKQLADAKAQIADYEAALESIKKYTVENKDMYELNIYYVIATRTLNKRKAKG